SRWVGNVLGPLVGVAALIAAISLLWRPAVPTTLVLHSRARAGAAPALVEPGDGSRRVHDVGPVVDEVLARVRETLGQCEEPVARTGPDRDAFEEALVQAMLASRSLLAPPADTGPG